MDLQFVSLLKRFLRVLESAHRRIEFLLKICYYIWLSYSSNRIGFCASSMEQFSKTPLQKSGSDGSRRN